MVGKLPKIWSFDVGKRPLDVRLFIQWKLMRSTKRVGSTLHSAYIWFSGDRDRMQSAVTIVNSTVEDFYSAQAWLC